MGGWLAGRIPVFLPTSDCPLALCAIPMMVRISAAPDRDVLISVNVCSKT